VALRPVSQPHPSNGQVTLKPLLELSGREWAKFHSYFRDREIADWNGSGPLRMPLWLFRRVVVGEEKSGDRTGFGVLDESGHFIGSVELYDLTPGRPQTPLDATLGIVIGEKHLWGRGYGTAALALVLEHAFTTMGLRRVRLETLENNVRARRAFEKVGFAFIRSSIQSRGLRYAHYALERDRWLQGSAE
jgi:RimJ/RimL family protein N-acetyltransferase